MNSSKAGIYKITNIVTGRFYVGSAINLVSRKWKHFNDLKKNIHGNKKLQCSYNKYGKDNFTFEILEYTEYGENLSDREQFYLDTLLSASFENDIFCELGFNILRLANNSTGYRHTDNVKKGVGLRSMGNKYRLGGKLSEENKLKIGWANKGNKHNIGRTRPDFAAFSLLKCKLSANEVLEIRKLYSNTTNYTEIGRKYGVARKVISQMLKGKTYTHI